MSRIAILGNTAGGKSTLSRHLAMTCGIPHIEIDAMFWQEDWTLVPSDVYVREHTAAIDQDQWIIDGGGDLASIKRRVDRATEIILLDLPLWVHFWRAAERQMAWASGALEHPPGGGKTMPPTGRLFELMWDLDREWMPVLRDLCDHQEQQGKTIVRLTSPEALDAFTGKS